MQEQLISFEVAKLAKKKGFKIGSRRSYTEYKDSYNYDDDPNHYESYKKGDINLDYNFYMVNNESELGDISNKLYNLYEAPTQSLLQRWLRETHNIEVAVIPTGVRKAKRYIPRFWFSGYEYNELDFETYEEAFDRGLYEALKLLP